MALGSAQAVRAMAGPRNVTALPKAGRKHIQLIRNARSFLHAAQFVERLVQWRQVPEVLDFELGEVALDDVALFFAGL